MEQIGKPNIPLHSLKRTPFWRFLAKLLIDCSVLVLSILVYFFLRFEGKIPGNHRRIKGTEVMMWGLNCRLDNLQAAILDVKLKKLPKWIERRREIAKMYQEGLCEIKEIKLPPPPEENGEHYDIYQNYEIEAERRDELMTYLRNKGVEVVIQWGGKAVHQFPALGLGDVHLPRTEEMFKKALLLPLYPELTDEQVRYVIDSIKEFYSQKSKDFPFRRN